LHQSRPVPEGADTGNTAATPPQAPAPESLTVVLVRPLGDQASKAAALLRMAYPGFVLTVCPNGAEAIARAATGKPAGVCCFDLADSAPGVLTSHLKQVARACPEAELVVLIEAADRPAIADILEVAPSPERLTFLIQPLDMQEAVKSLRAVAARYLARLNAGAAMESRDRDVRRLSAEAMEVPGPAGRGLARGPPRRPDQPAQPRRIHQ